MRYPKTVANVARWFYTVSQITLIGALANLVREGGPRWSIGLIGVGTALVILVVAILLDRRAERIEKEEPHG